MKKRNEFWKILIIILIIILSLALIFIYLEDNRKDDKVKKEKKTEEKEEKKEEKKEIEVERPIESLETEKPMVIKVGEIKDYEKLKEELSSLKDELSYYKDTNLVRYIKYKDKNRKLDNKKVILYVNIGLDKKFYSDLKPVKDPNSYSFIVNKYNKLPEGYRPNDLVTNPREVCSDGRVNKLRKEASENFVRLHNDAKKEGITILSMSPYRSHETQVNLFNRYVRQDGKAAALRYSAMPGTSEHETGLALDVKTPNRSYLYFHNDTKAYNWMKNNSYKYGFIERYPKGKEHITGYKYESWHYRFIGVDLAKKYKESGLGTYEEFYYTYLDK